MVEYRHKEATLGGTILEEQLYQLDLQLQNTLMTTKKTEGIIKAYEEKLRILNEKLEQYYGKRQQFILALQTFDENRNEKTLEALQAFFDTKDLLAKQKFSSIRESMICIAKIRQENAKLNEELGRLISAENIIQGFQKEILKYVNKAVNPTYNAALSKEDQETAYKISEEAIYHKILSYSKKGKLLLDKVQKIDAAKILDDIPIQIELWSYYLVGRILQYALDRFMKYKRRSIRLNPSSLDSLSAADTIDAVLIELDDYFLENMYEYKELIFETQKKILDQQTRKQDLIAASHTIWESEKIIYQYVLDKVDFVNNPICKMDEDILLINTLQIYQLEKVMPLICKASDKVKVIIVAVDEIERKNIAAIFQDVKMKENDYGLKKICMCELRMEDFSDKITGETVSEQIWQLKAFGFVNRLDFGCVSPIIKALEREFYINYDIQAIYALIQMHRFIDRDFSFLDFLAQHVIKQTDVNMVYNIVCICINEKIYDDNVMLLIKYLINQSYNKTEMDSLLVYIKENCSQLYQRLENYYRTSL